MKTISYYISMVVILAATIFTGCTDDDEKSLSPRAGELSIYDFAPNTGKGGTQLLINGEQFPLDATSISVSINEVQLSILRSNEEQLLVEVPDNEAIGTAPIVIKTNGKTTQSEVNFIFQKTAITGYSPAYGKVGMQPAVHGLIIHPGQHKRQKNVILQGKRIQQIKLLKHKSKIVTPEYCTL